MPVATVEAGRRREAAALAALLLATVAPPLVRLDQPIVENYVGRQVPTAMVARNLDRGSGFLRPQLDTGPFPNLFLVEPPVYAAAVVGLRRLTGLADRPRRAGSSRRWRRRLGAWGLFGLVRRRERAAVALRRGRRRSRLLPVMIRYGRAVQPDAPDARDAAGGPALLGRLRRPAGAGGWLAVGWALLATSLALKVTRPYPCAAADPGSCSGAGDGERSACPCWRSCPGPGLVRPRRGRAGRGGGLAGLGRQRADLARGAGADGACSTRRPTGRRPGSSSSGRSRRSASPSAVVGLVRRPVDRLWPAWGGRRPC